MADDSYYAKWSSHEKNYIKTNARRLNSSYRVMSRSKSPVFLPKTTNSNQKAQTQRQQKMDSKTKLLTVLKKANIGNSLTYKIGSASKNELKNDKPNSGYFNKAPPVTSRSPTIIKLSDPRTPHKHRSHTLMADHSPSPVRLIRLASLLNNQPSDDRVSDDAFDTPFMPSKQADDMCVKLDIISNKCKVDVIRKINLMNTRATHNLSADKPIAKRYTEIMQKYTLQRP